MIYPDSPPQEILFDHRRGFARGDRNPAEITFPPAVRQNVPEQVRKNLSRFSGHPPFLLSDFIGCTAQDQFRDHLGIKRGRLDVDIRKAVQNLLPVFPAERRVGDAQSGAQAFLHAADIDAAAV